MLYEVITDFINLTSERRVTTWIDNFEFWGNINLINDLAGKERFEAVVVGWVAKGIYLNCLEVWRKPWACSIGAAADKGHNRQSYNTQKYF